MPQESHWLVVASRSSKSVLQSLPPATVLASQAECSETAIACDALLQFLDDCCRKLGPIPSYMCWQTLSSCSGCRTHRAPSSSVCSCEFIVLVVLSQMCICFVALVVLVVSRLGRTRRPRRVRTCGTSVLLATTDLACQVPLATQESCAIACTSACLAEPSWYCLHSCLFKHS